MSRWDSLRPSQEGPKDPQNDGHHRNGKKPPFVPQNLQSSGRGNDRWRDVQPSSSSTGRSNGRDGRQATSHSTSRPRIRLRLGSAVMSDRASASELQKHIDDIRKHTNLLSDRTPDSTEFKTAFSKLEQSVQALDTVSIQNGENCTEICRVLGDTLAIRIKNDDLRDAILQVSKKSLRQVKEKKWELSLSKDESTHLMKMISSHCRHEAATEGICILSNLVILQLDTLPAEETTHFVVNSVFLPFLEEHKNASTDDVGRVISAIYGAMNALLKNQRHASALLAPLVLDISMKDGRENAIANPTRVRILEALPQQVSNDVHEKGDLELSELKIEACRVLTGAVEAIRRLNDPSSANSQEGSRLVLRLKIFIYTAISPSSEANNGRDTGMQKVALELLLALLRCYPKSTTALGWNFLVEERGSIFLQPYTDAEITSLSLQLLTEFIKIMPWKRWLNQVGRKRVANKSGLYRKASTALCSLFTEIDNKLQSTEDQGSFVGFQGVVKALLVDVLCDDEDVLHASVKLWETVTVNISDPSLSQDKRRMAITVLTLCAGGYTTPSGELVGMCQAGINWLSNAEGSSSRFVKSLFATSSSGSKSTAECDEVLIAILRTYPYAALQNWSAYELFVKHLCVEDRVRCLKIVEAFMVGRKHFGSEEEAEQEILPLALRVLESAKEEQTTQSIKIVLSIYSCFLSKDWGLLYQKIELDYHLGFLKINCTSSNAKIREMTCKAMGEFCTQFFTSSIHFDIARLDSYQSVAKDVCTKMLETSADSNAAVRAMAVFALGNLANAIRQSSSLSILNKETLRGMCRTVLDCFGDSNDKVVGNAVRCIGHAGSIVATNPPDAASIELLAMFIKVLTTKLSNALIMVLNWESKANYTWKQRSTAKKHGWGSCHALKMIFQGLRQEGLDEKELRDEVSNAFKYLALCQEHYESLIPKVVEAAIGAVSCLSRQALEMIGTETQLVGDALANAVLILSDTTDVTGKFYDKNAELLLHLLQAASISDAYHALANEELSIEILNKLYSWMVEQDDDCLNARPFEIFALSLQRSRRLDDTVALEQKFASRALWKNKQYHDAADGEDEI